MTGDGMIGRSEPTEAHRQDIRIAVVLNGGVSLAVWIGGVVFEIHRLVQSSRRSGQTGAEDVYGQIFDELKAHARVDVIAGTSAGGLNGGFLALGIVHGCDLSTMRTMWEHDGDLAALLRDPREKQAPSLLRGDYFFERLKDAYSKAWRTRKEPVNDDPLELLLTGTLWAGRRSPFTDNMGRTITEVDYDATFRFASVGDLVDDPGAGDLRSENVLSQLAVASRCTSSFPGAFEPYYVKVDQRKVGDRWASSAGLANFSESQYVVDGGVLLNKPIRPALRSIYRQAAASQVRRVLAYVVPDPGEESDAVPTDRGSDRSTGTGAVPTAWEVLLGTLSRLRSTDSVSSELAEIEQRNDEARFRRRARDRFAAALTTAHRADREDSVGSPSDGEAQGASGLALAAWNAYRQVRIDHGSRNVANLLSSANTPTEVPWSVQELTTTLVKLADPGALIGSAATGRAGRAGLPWIPHGSLDDALRRVGGEWDWGQTSVGRLGDMALDILKRAMWLAPMDGDARQHLAESRRNVHAELDNVWALRARLDGFWRDRGRLLPPRSTKPIATRDELAELEVVLTTAVDDWETQQPDPRAAMYGQALSLATCLFHAKAALAASVEQPSKLDPEREETARLVALIEALFNAARKPEHVLRRMLELDVVQLAFTGAAREVEQEVELVQVSTPNTDLLTGVQAYHFGAFYRPSWRVNDWLRGRLDGVEQLVQILLAPERLRQLGHTAESAYEIVRRLAVENSTLDRSYLAGRWPDLEIKKELACLDDPAPLPRTFPTSAACIAERLKLGILRAELPALEESISYERDALPTSVGWAQRLRDLSAQGGLDATELQELYERSEAVGAQQISDEVLNGTDTFAKTASHATASLISMTGSVSKPKLVVSLMSALRGYALMVWALVSYSAGKSNVGANVVTLVVGLGAALLGITLIVPGVPIGVPLVGTVLMLGAVSAASLRTRRRLGLRLLVAAAIAAAALASTVVWGLLGEEAAQWRADLLGALVKIVVVIAVVLLGWWVARTKPTS